MLQRRQQPRTASLDLRSRRRRGCGISPSSCGQRSGETPRQVLGGTEHAPRRCIQRLQRRRRGFDARTRGCHAHLRRYFHESLATAPIAQEAIDLILDLTASASRKGTPFVGTPHIALQRAGRACARHPRMAGELSSIDIHPSPIDRDPLRTEQLGRTRLLPRRRQAPARQQRIGTRVAKGRTRPQELPLRRRSQRWSEPGRALLSRRDMRSSVDQPVRVPRRRPHAHRGPPTIPTR